MILKAVLYLIGFIFLLKLLWNSAIPYISVRQYFQWKRVEGKEPGGISFDVVSDMLLLILFCMLYFFSNNIIYGRSTFEIFIMGLLLIVLSYLMTIVVAIICRYIYK